MPTMRTTHRNANAKIIKRQQKLDDAMYDAKFPVVDYIERRRDARSTDQPPATNHRRFFFLKNEETADESATANRRFFGLKHHKASPEDASADSRVPMGPPPVEASKEVMARAA